MKNLHRWAGAMAVLGIRISLAEDPAVRFSKHVIDPDFPAISVTATDVDGDGRLDVVAAGGPSGGRSPWSGTVNWYRAPGWEKALVCRLDAASIILHLEAVDFSRRTGRSATAGELVVTDGELGNIWWYRYDRDLKEWIGRVVVEDVRYAHGTAAGDIDGDGLADLLVPTQHGTPRQGLVWAKNPGAPDAPWTRFPLAPAFHITGWQHYVRLTDLNGDGKLDALHASNSKAGWFGFWLQGASPTEPWEARALAGPFTECTNLDAADVNGDGRLDLVGSEGHGRGLWWFPAPGYGAVRIDDTLESAHSIALADYDGNGAPDVASCGYQSRRVACFLNDGKGRFRDATLDTNQCAYDASAVDVNGDGRPDLLIAGQNSTNVVWYENLQ